ncbi:hypothetical protein LY76DRAFT_598725 [Colletotrichum caudatum]|nr:hypothetical protein LY76DRAFT_598725 [Colletotrichum caudatum]
MPAFLWASYEVVGGLGQLRLVSPSQSLAYGPRPMTYLYLLGLPVRATWPLGHHPRA